MNCESILTITNFFDSLAPDGFLIKPSGVFYPEFHHSSKSSLPCQCSMQSAMSTRSCNTMRLPDHMLTGEALPAEERQTSFREMMQVALETAVKLEK